MLKRCPEALVKFLVARVGSHALQIAGPFDTDFDIVEDLALAQEDDSVRECDRFTEVMSDEDDCALRSGLPQFEKLLLDRDSSASVEGCEGFVHQ